MAIKKENIQNNTKKALSCSDIKIERFLAKLKKSDFIEHKGKNYCLHCYELGDVRYVGINRYREDKFIGINYCSRHGSLR